MTGWLIIEQDEKLQSNIDEKLGSAQENKLSNPMNLPIFPLRFPIIFHAPVKSMERQTHKLGKNERGE